MATVLLVMPDFRSEPLHQHLEQTHLSVKTANTAAVARQLLERVPVDVVVLDTTNPPVDGWILLRYIHANNAVPVILIVEGGGDDVVWGLSLGAADCVVQPISAEVLAARVHAILRRAQGQEATGV